jgi:Na+/H+-dicarboxylate symporter
MSEARALTNTIGNAVGTMAIARWVGAMDVERVHAVLDGKAVPPPDAAAPAHAEQPAAIAFAADPALQRSI